VQLVILVQSHFFGRCDQVGLGGRLPVNAICTMGGYYGR